MKKSSILITLAVLALNACYYDKESVLYPNQAACSTPATVSYGQHVLPILQQYCYGCHSGNAPGGNIAMGTWSADNAIAINGKLYGTIAWAGGFSPMPQGGSKLSACNIELIKKWVDNGAPNN
ncbi:MAG TPA: cytochrome c [Ferruginibacter sp.]|nr:cytochrome c [Ferruginibacter sp.]